jgi:uncharacterized protein (TIGR00369 family)
MFDLPELLTGLDELIGVTMENLTPDHCRLRLEIDGRHHQPFGFVHGGTYCTIVETAASTAAALWAMSNGMRGAVGVSNTTDFYRSHREGTMTAVASPVHRGRSQQVWQVEVTREADGKLLARGQVRLHNLQQPGRGIGADETSPGD